MRISRNINKDVKAMIAMNVHHFIEEVPRDLMPSTTYVRGSGLLKLSNNYKYIINIYLTLPLMIKGDNGFRGHHLGHVEKGN